MTFYEEYVNFSQRLDNSYEARVVIKDISQVSKKLDLSDIDFRVEDTENDGKGAVLVLDDMKKNYGKEYPFLPKITEEILKLFSRSELDIDVAGEKNSAFSFKRMYDFYETENGRSIQVLLIHPEKDGLKVFNKTEGKTKESIEKILKDNGFKLEREKLDRGFWMWNRSYLRGYCCCFERKLNSNRGR